MGKALKDLRRVVSRLRSPSGGCPWDRKQTHVSLIPYLQEESKELAQALKRGRWHEVEDELGDVLFQVLLHAQIAEENNLFTLDDVMKSQAVKLIRRHPHVFGRDFKFKSAEDVKLHWHEVKSIERAKRKSDIARRIARKNGPKLK